jgi:nucleotide-binding universal stress UspA family protein
MAHTPFPYRSILVPLDGSKLAAEALLLAARIARSSGAKLRLALVHQHPSILAGITVGKAMTNIELAARKAERAYLRETQSRLREEGTRVASAVTLTGPVCPALVTYVRELGVDLVVMATHGHGGLRRAWLGSVADYLVHHLQVPILLVRPASAHRVGVHPTEVLVPLDGSPLAEEAIGPAVDLARSWGAGVSLLQIVEPFLLSTEPTFPVPYTYDGDLTNMTRDAAQDYLDDVVERLREEGVRATGAAVIGWNTADAILEAAHPERVVMLALATHGRGGLQRLMLGSVADKLIRGADVPVLVHRPAGPVERKTRGARPRRVPRAKARS